MNRKAKRVFDFLFALLLVILSCPVAIIISIAVRYNLGRPIFFLQDRIGKDGKKFKIIKFKSMLNIANSSTDGTGTNPLSDQHRMTKFGQWLRNNSLDEIPQLINILKGDMSFVGPRPWPAKYLNVYSKEQFKRHDVCPRITGFSQINGRNFINWCDKIRMDIWYIENWSLTFDVKILVLTVPALLNKDNIEITEEFRGNN